MNHPSLVITSAEMLLIKSAKAFDQKDSGHDVAAFKLKDYQAASLAVSKVPPKRGDRCYLLARPRGEEKLRLLSATINRVGVDAIEYLYDEVGGEFCGNERSANSQ